MNPTFEFKRVGGGYLKEYFDGKSWWLEYSEGDIKKALKMYDLIAEETYENPLFLGHTVEEVLNSGKDILGRELMAKGEVSYPDVVGVLPPVTQDAYCFIGGPASHSNMTVDTRGAVYRQLYGRDIGGERGPNYEPWHEIPEIKDVAPRQVMLSEEIPVLINVYELSEETVEIIYFIEPGDSGRDPTLWIRKKRYKGAELRDLSYEYNSFELYYELPNRPGDAASFSEDQVIVEVEKYASDDTVKEAFTDTVAYWVKFLEKGISVCLPEERLNKIARGAMAAAATTCTTDRPHYGHRYYGKEIHDNFPPNYIWIIETACIMGRPDWAKRVFDHLLTYATTDEGKIVYRQGRAQNYGASATEYSILLFLAERYFDKLGLADLDEEKAAKLLGMGDHILAHCVPCPEFEGRTLVKMCAEADTNSRVHVYLNNNLWSIRGLRALDGIIDRLGRKNSGKYRKMADIIWQNIDYLLAKRAIYDERFGLVPPFRLDYEAKPHTLSNCRDTYSPMTDEEYKEYISASISRGKEKENGQDVTENCYANYRYYPELLSAMLLPKEMADGAEKIREELGGEIMGMTRFRSWIDNWPVLHHARFLIETDRIEKYLLLLYSHTELHGHRERLCYYEQVRLDGRYNMPDCVPSLLTAPCMIGWMLAYEKMDGGLSLLKALPKDWYGKEFSARGIGYSGGSVDISSDGSGISFKFSSPSPEGAVVVWRAKENITEEEVLSGMEYIERIDGNKLTLKSGLTSLRISIKA